MYIYEHKEQSFPSILDETHGPAYPTRLDYPTR